LFRRHDRHEKIACGWAPPCHPLCPWASVTC
jgi:hypothetical protein